MTAHYQNFLLVIILFMGALMCISTGWFAFQTNGNFGFPLDDPWIHLQFAKNLHDYGSFSYFKNEMITSGSTAPLYTVLLSIGFFITLNEMILSYVLGVSFLLLAGYYVFKLSILEFEGNMLFGYTAVVLLLFEPRLQWIALSGMETTLFIFLLIAATYYYKARKPIPLGVVIGLLLWVRPEALLFIVVLTIDALHHDWSCRQSQPKKKSSVVIQSSWVRMKGAFLIFLVFGLLYAGFNFWLSGSVFPNTYAAKIKYYSGGGKDFPLQVYHFLIDGHFTFLAFFMAVGIISTFYKIIKRQSNLLLIPFLWSAGLFLAYWNSLPYLYQEGRYLMPILPFIILIGLHGVRTTIEVGGKYIHSLTRRRAAFIVTCALFSIFAVQFIFASWERRATYAEYCKYISDRQVRTAKWLRDNLPENAIIATHDIGAISFYSGRRIADMVGLVSPEMIDNIGSFAKLQRFLILKKATHLAVLRNWFEVTNQNPIFQTDERFPEIMEVFEFDPARVHFTPQNAGRLTDVAEYYLSIGNAQQAGQMLEQALRIDPQSSKTHYLLGKAFAAAGKLERAEQEFRAALQLHPTLWDAQLEIALIAVKKNQLTDAITQLESLIKINPSLAAGYQTLAQIYQTFHLDSLKAIEYLQQFNQLTTGSVR
jgi:tetratricopeptide (TPR) repeat protein